MYIVPVGCTGSTAGCDHRPRRRDMAVQAVLQLEAETQAQEAEVQEAEKGGQKNETQSREHSQQRGAEQEQTWQQGAEQEQPWQQQGGTAEGAGAGPLPALSLQDLEEWGLASEGEGEDLLAAEAEAERIGASRREAGTQRGRGWEEEGEEAEPPRAAKRSRVAGL